MSVDMLRQRKISANIIMQSLWLQLNNIITLTCRWDLEFVFCGEKIVYFAANQFQTNRRWCDQLKWIVWMIDSQETNYIVIKNTSSI